MESQRTRPGWKLGLLAWAAMGLLSASPTLAGRRGEPDPPDYGLSWRSIGDPGNRATRPDEITNPNPGTPAAFGSVPYRYRLTTTEITIEQWFEFVQAYAPYYEGPGVNSAFTGFGITYSAGSYFISGNPDGPSNMSWEYAARYCNWLHNNKNPAEWAFQSGAYDTSTFTQNPDGSWNHQAERSPGAIFWIPNLDEWTKGAHWDPEADHYWYQQGSQDEPLISGSAQNGGQTNAGPNGGPVEAGSYPTVQSPWGLLDTSGGVRELVEDIIFGVSNERMICGSTRLDLSLEARDRVPGVYPVFVTSSQAGLRLASVIPSCSSLAVFAPFIVPLYRRRRQWSEHGSTGSRSLH